MKQQLTIGTYTVTFDIEALKKSAEHATDDFYFDNEFTGDDNGYQQTEEQFKEAKEAFLKEIDGLANILPQAFQKGVKLTKKGQFDRRKNHVVLESGMITGYSDHYGSHAYNVPSLVASQTGVGTAEIFYEEIGHQDSF